MDFGLEDRKKGLMFVFLSIFLSVLLSFCLPAAIIFLFKEKIAEDGNINIEIIWIVLISVIIMSPINFFAIRYVIKRFVIGESNSDDNF